VNLTNTTWQYFQPFFEYQQLFNDYNWPWRGHRFFAYDYIRNFKPTTIVELGTHKGTSLFSFAQAVKDGKLGTRITAIDSWKGDEHAGFYGESVYAEVKEIACKYYSAANITLLKMYFDEALDKIEDNSIDLLHIDGLHTYEAVMNDFNTWQPKLAPHFTVFFHDTNVSSFGVKQVFDELKKNYKDCLFFEFEHSYGLGVMTNLQELKEYLSNKQRLSFFIKQYESKSLQEIHMTFQNELNTILKDNENIAQQRGFAENELRLKNNELSSMKNELNSMQENHKLLTRTINALNEDQLKYVAENNKLNQHLEWYYKNYDKRNILKLFGDRIFKRKTRAKDRPNHIFRPEF
jgi:Methyltransferase domain